jgi:hypothetical protein
MPMAICCWAKLRTFRNLIAILIIHNLFIHHFVYFFQLRFLWAAFEDLSGHYYNSRSEFGPSLHLCPPPTKIPGENASCTREGSRSLIAWECLNKQYDQSLTNNQDHQIWSSSIATMSLEQTIDKFNCDKVAWTNNQDDHSRRCLRMISQSNHDDAHKGSSSITMMLANDQVQLQWCPTNNSAVQSQW